ncbi:MAG: hypothetical protein NUW22_02470 [Acidobacteria bacterium]|nr:hypothetical protein [Acidobacteriota bacterium]
MTRYFHEIDDEVFEIDVCAMAQGCDAVSPFFVAYVSRLDRSELVPVMSALGRREVYGPTEAWAVQNARDLLASNSWRARPTAVCRIVNEN